MSGDDIILAVIRNLHRAKDFVLSHICSIKFIGVPIYLVSLNSDVKGHLNPTVLLDFKADFQFDLLNKHIKEINTQLGRNTLKFNADLRAARRGEKRHNFELLPDGVHPIHLLGQKCLRRLELNIVIKCFLPTDTLEVDDQ